MRIWGLACAALLLSACATWEKPGATDAERRLAVAQCRSEAEARLPPVWENNIRRPGHWVPSRTECGREPGSCRKSGSYFQWPEYRSRDVNAPLRDTLVQTCMHDRGWTQQGGL